MRTNALAEYMTNMITELNRFSVGMEPTFRTLDYVRQNSSTGFPPYDIERLSENQYRLTMAVAGYTADDIEIVQEDTLLTITGHAATSHSREYLFKGIAQRQFRRSFWLDNWVKVSGTRLENGILTVDFQQEIPEAHLPRKIPVGFSSPALAKPETQG
jgi:molecular chaperone IbpA